MAPAGVVATKDDTSTWRADVNVQHAELRTEIASLRTDMEAHAA